MPFCIDSKIAIFTLRMAFFDHKMAILILKIAFFDPNNGNLTQNVAFFNSKISILGLKMPKIQVLDL